MGVVVGLEAVDVQHQQGQRPLMAPGAPPFQDQAFIQGAAIGDAGQWVPAAQIAQQIFMGLEAQVQIHPCPH